jgi:hypothetical protein
VAEDSNVANARAPAIRVRLRKIDFIEIDDLGLGRKITAQICPFRAKGSCFSKYAAEDKTLDVPFNGTSTAGELSPVGSQPK